jgi:hypothetical protein|uniref:Uncharacterized protein n=1 Tax=Picea glauca TaxID=3330 RepID=A0A101M0L7_PICGL|nr:hypothetical protein ABT39_MTgene4098 [Picea glauca]QHR92545.1 hypothetical protein Q903MT_gene6591 [Picea sitchensis]
MRGQFVESILEVPSLVLLYNSHQLLIGNYGPRRALSERPGMPVLSVVLQKIGIEARLWKALHQFDIEKGGGI